MVFWRDILVPITEKCFHINKIGGRVKNAFVKTYGDIPVANLNEITNKLEPVVNNRGRAYAARRRLSYRKKV